MTVPSSASGEPPPLTDDVSEPAPVQKPAVSISLGSLSWVIAAAGFILLRLGPTWQANVYGAEIPHLSGAWQARIGVVDDRFVPTLFQALASLLLHAGDSAVPVRVAAFLATASIPFALWLLRPAVGEAGALIALLLLALDPAGLGLGTSASAMGFDEAITVWLAVVILRPRMPLPVLACAGFLVATAGPLPLPLVFAGAVIRLFNRDYPRPAALLATGGGAVAGLVLASAEFGLGFHRFVVPPFDLFSAGFDERWSTGTTADLVALYGLPLLVIAIATGAWLVGGARRRTPSRAEVLILAWLAVSLAWLLASLDSHNPSVVAAASLPAALLAGPAVARALGAAFRADWSLARWLVPGACFLTLVAGAFVLAWARNETTGGTRDVLVVCSLLTLAGVALVVVGSNRTALPTLAVPAFGLLAIPLIAPAFGVALSARYEPLLSPFVPDQARELRDAALSTVGEHGGLVVIHPDFADAVTWPFRDSGNIVVSSRVPPDAAVVLWPRDLPKPEGLSPLEGNWALQRNVLPPTGDMLEYFHWLIDRQSVRLGTTGLAVYTRGSK